MGIINHHKKLVLGFLIVILFIVIFTAIYFFSRGFSYKELKELIEMQGIMGYVIYVIFLILTTVIAPLTSVPLLPIALFAYGYKNAVILTFIGNSIGSFTNFLIARKFGRPIIKKLVGMKGIEKIDEFAKEAGWKTFLIMRILANISSDYISYAMGLTKFNTSIYLLITFFTSLVWISLVFFLLQTAFSLGRIPSIVIIVTAYALSLYSGFRVWKRHKIRH